MITAMYTSATGLQAFQEMLDITSNNLANINTIGFKHNEVNFEDLLYMTALLPGNQVVQGTSVPTGIQLGTGVFLSSNLKVFTQGPLDNTGRSLDVAIDGQGFFQFTAPDGSLVYSRDGALSQNNLGQLTNAQGLLLTPNITIPTDTTSILISTGGVVSVITPSSPTPTTVGNIELALFPNPPGLTAIGNNLFAQSPSSGAPTTDAPGSNGLGTTQQFFLEQSNVDTVGELVNLILAQRAFAFNTRALNVADEILQDTATLIT